MKIDDVTLMRFHDGELDAEAARRVRLARLSDRSVSARLEGLEQLGEFVRIWAANDTSRGVRPAPALRSKPRRALALAVAASLVALVSSIPGTLPNGVPAPVALAASVHAPTEARAPAAEPEPAVAVENVDFGAREGAVFLVQSALSETTVVWLTEGPLPAVTGTL
ncbi:MAG TPA: hypothetical protein VGK73_09075 [Polyangiaceae bacterium]